MRSEEEGKGKLWCFHIFNSYSSINELQLEGLRCHIGIIKFSHASLRKKIRMSPKNKGEGRRMGGRADKRETD